MYILEDEKSFSGEIKSIFHYFKGLPLKQIKYFFGRRKKDFKKG